MVKKKAKQMNRSLRENTFLAMNDIICIENEIKVVMMIGTLFIEQTL